MTAKRTSVPTTSTRIFVKRFKLRHFLGACVCSVMAFLPPGRARRSAERWNQEGPPAALLPAHGRLAAFRRRRSSLPLSPPPQPPPSSFCAPPHTPHRPV